MLNNTQEQIQVIKCLAVIMCKLRHPVGLVSGASSARRNLLKLINIRYSCVILCGRKVHTTLVPMTTHEFLRLGVIFFLFDYGIGWEAFSSLLHLSVAYRTCIYSNGTAAITFGTVKVAHWFLDLRTEEKSQPRVLLQFSLPSARADDLLCTSFLSYWVLRLCHFPLKSVTNWNNKNRTSKLIC